jgi:hypothetical protein
MREADMQETNVQYIYIGDTFCCPFCGTKYYLTWIETGPFAYPAEGKPCEHLGSLILPAGDDKYRVTFTPPIEEDAPLARKLDYLLHSTAPFRAWLARKNPWDVVGRTGKGNQNPLALFLGEYLKPEEVWVTPEGAIYVRDRSGVAVFIPQPSPGWIHALVQELHKYKGRAWLALEVLAIIEDIRGDPR